MPNCLTICVLNCIKVAQNLLQRLAFWAFWRSEESAQEATWPSSRIFTISAGYRFLGALLRKTAVFAKTNVCEQYTLSAESEKSPTAWPCALQFSRKFIKLVELLDPMQFSLHKSRSKTAPIFQFLSTLAVSRQVTWSLQPTALYLLLAQGIGFW